MKITHLFAVIAALLAIIPTALANPSEFPNSSKLTFKVAQPEPQVPDFNVAYNWSFSGKQYVTATKAIRKNVLVDGMDFVAAAGYELTTGVQPSFGFGFSYGLDFDGFYVRAVATTLFPQNGPPDVAVGVMFGVRF